MNLEKTLEYLIFGLVLFIVAVLTFTSFVSRVLEKSFKDSLKISSLLQGANFLFGFLALCMLGPTLNQYAKPFITSLSSWMWLASLPVMLIMAPLCSLLDYKLLKQPGKENFKVLWAGNTSVAAVLLLIYIYTSLR